MRERFVNTPGIVLSVRKFGEINKSLDLLTPEYGIINTIAHGAQKPKSKLAAASDLYVSAFYQLYYNPVKDNWTVKSASNLYQSEIIRSNVKAYALAGLCAEIIRHSFAGGVAEKVFKLFDAWLRLLAIGPEDLEIQAMQFILRFLAFAGFYHGASYCSACNTDTANDAYLLNDFSITCSKCKLYDSIKVDKELLEYVDYSLTFQLSQAYKIPISPTKAINFFHTITRILENFLGRKFQFYEYYKRLIN